jgi:hypothetical protein
VLSRGAAWCFQRRDLLVGSDGFLDVAKGRLGQARALGQDFDLFRVGSRLGHAFAQEAIEIGKAVGFGQHAFEQRQGLGVEGNRGQGLAQGGHGVVHIAGLVPPARDLVVQARGAFGTVGAVPVGIGVDRRQRLQGLVIARIKPDYIAQLLRGLGQIADLFGQNAPEAEHECDAPLGIGGAGQLDLEQAADHGIVAERIVDLAHGLHDLELLGGDFGAQAWRGQCIFDARDVLAVGAVDFGAQFVNAGGVARLAQGRGFDLKHVEVLAGPALLAVDVLEPLDRLAVGCVAADSMSQVGFRAGYVRQVIDANFRGQVEELCGLGLIRMAWARVS